MELEERDIGVAGGMEQGRPAVDRGRGGIELRHVAAGGAVEPEGGDGGGRRLAVDAVVGREEVGNAAAQRVGHQGSRAQEGRSPVHILHAGQGAGVEREVRVAGGVDVARPRLADLERRGIRHRGVGPPQVDQPGHGDAHARRIGAGRQLDLQRRRFARDGGQPAKAGGDPCGIHGHRAGAASHPRIQNLRLRARPA